LRHQNSATTLDRSAVETRIFKRYRTKEQTRRVEQRFRIRQVFASSPSILRETRIGLPPIRLRDLRTLNPFESPDVDRTQPACMALIVIQPKLHGVADGRIADQSRTMEKEFAGFTADEAETSWKPRPDFSNHKEVLEKRRARRNRARISGERARTDFSTNVGRAPLSGSNPR
jgi:hypothetical protein